MIGEPKPQLRETLIADLETQTEQFLAAGKSIQTIHAGHSRGVTLCAFSSQQKRHQAERAKLAPTLRAHANAGMTLHAAALVMKIKYERAQLIARENHIVFTAT